MTLPPPPPNMAQTHRRIGFRHGRADLDNIIDIRGNLLRGLGSWGNFPDMNSLNEMITR